MPRIEIPVTEIVRSGAAQPGVTSSDAGDGHYIAANNGDVELEITNIGASDQIVEIEANPDLNNDGLTFANLELLIPYGETWLFGPFKKHTFKQDSSGMMHLNPSVSTDLEIRAYKRVQAPN